MFVLFEDSGAFKTGTILTETEASLQIETTHGKRVKLKRNHVLLRFCAPSPAALIDQGQADAETMDIDFLWEVGPDDEFEFSELAQDYFGHAPSAVELAALLLRLHSAPMHFHRKGRGRFRKAPAEILQAALAGLEKKRQQAELMESMRTELVSGKLPSGFLSILPQILYRPDRNRLEVKALEAACIDTGLSAAQLMLQCGAISSSYEYHFNRFLFEYFPDGEGFADFIPPQLPADLPVAEIRAFSIDDSTTTEIDDAFSITLRSQGGWRIGIHIAAPALGFGRGSSLDEIARRRLSTVYMPGNKITMLPDSVVETFTLAAGTVRPAVSLYLDVSPALAITGYESRIERIPIVANLRLNDVEPLFNETMLHHGGPAFEWKEELTLLWNLATVLEAGRGKVNANQNQIDYNFYVDWDKATEDGAGFVTITRRQRGAPLDKLVSELMILANSTWGKMLDDAGVPGLYRIQNGGKVRMSTAAEPHEALGVDCYAWSSSPLRRYVDLVNQWQLIAVISGSQPAFAPKSADLFAAMRDFELTYAAYAEFQRQMERYWCLRWLRQTRPDSVEARCLRDNVVRLTELPLVIKVPGLPPLVPGSLIRLAVGDSDLIDMEIRMRYLETLAEPTPEERLESGFERG